MTKSLFRLLVVVMCLALLALPISRAQADESSSVNVTVTVTLTLSVSVTPSSWDIGMIPPETTNVDTISTPPGGPEYFAATNDGNGFENLHVRISCDSGWTPSSDPGINAFAMNLSKDQGASWNLIDPTSGIPLVMGLAAGATQSFDLQLLLPATTTTGGMKQTITITVTASSTSP
jgi:hypothetical protein